MWPVNQGEPGGFLSFFCGCSPLCHIHPQPEARSAFDNKTCASPSHQVGVEDKSLLVTGAACYPTSEQIKSLELISDVAKPARPVTSSEH